MNYSKSMLEVAYEIIAASETPLAFKDLYEEVSKKLSMTQEDFAERIGEFYTQLTLDSRFVTLIDNTWDLRSRHTYDKVHMDVNDFYSEVEESDDDEEDKKDEKEYNAEVEGKPILDDEEELSEDEEGENAPQETLSSLGLK